jgi:hypothetical protein
MIKLNGIRICVFQAELHPPLKPTDTRNQNSLQVALVHLQRQKLYSERKEASK